MNDSAAAEDRDRTGAPAFAESLREVTGVQLDRDDFVQILHRLASHNPIGIKLSAHDARILEEAGFVGDRGSTTATRLPRDARVAGLVRTFLSIDDAAARLGITVQRVRQRIADGTLWAFGSGRNLLSEQLTGTVEVPHLDKIMPSIEKNLHPLTAHGLLTQPQDSLVDDSRPVSIVAWLSGSAGSDADIGQDREIITAAEWESV